MPHMHRSDMFAFAGWLPGGTVNYWFRCTRLDCEQFNQAVLTTPISAGTDTYRCKSVTCSQHKRSIRIPNAVLINRPTDSCASGVIAAGLLRPAAGPTVRPSRSHNPLPPASQLLPVDTAVSVRWGKAKKAWPAVVIAVWPTNRKAYTVEFLQGQIAQVTQASVADADGPNTV